MFALSYHFSSISNNKEIVSLNSSIACGRDGHVKREIIATGNHWDRFLIPRTQVVTPLSVQTAGGKQRVNCATQQGIFRIIQSIPSKKAEPFKQWMAQGGTGTLIHAKELYQLTCPS